MNKNYSYIRIVNKHHAGLVGYWCFDESSGTTATDSSPNGNNGTLK
ncbi:MAG: hypothetical protein AABZ32_12970 [Bacteroidota bacterium]